MEIKENMNWPPTDLLSWKMQEHSAWYSGDAETLANFYAFYLAHNVQEVPYPMSHNEMFWGRQLKNQGEIFVHVPIASDIAETSANFLFSESPLIKIGEAHEKKAASSFKDTQDEMDAMLLESGFYRKILEAADACAGIGGVYIKLAWDNELSPYPIPVIVQSDRAIPEFKFGILSAVTFWQLIETDESGSKVYRLLERYDHGVITNSLYLGTTDKLGRKVSLKAHPETQDLPETQDTVDALLAVYIPNMLPNRLNRNSYIGRSDYMGIEGLMDSLDQIYSSWMKDIALAQAQILAPESYFSKMSDGASKYNLDKMLYVKLDIDPVSEGDKITCNQFDIRAEEFEKSSLNIMERIITSAGYSPQSFGLNIEGRAESGTALSIRERKSFATRNKKEKYWHPAIKRLIQLMLLVYKEELDAKIEVEVDLNVAFSDGITNNLNEVATSVKMISDAQAASTKTKVMLLHPEWSEEQVKAEVAAIQKENNMLGAGNPDGMRTKDQFEKEMDDDEIEE